MTVEWYSLSALFCLKDLLQPGSVHLYGFSPVCVRRCWSRACWAEKPSPHSSQVKGLSDILISQFFAVERWGHYVQAVCVVI